MQTAAARLSPVSTMALESARHDGRDARRRENGGNPFPVGSAESLAWQEGYLAVHAELGAAQAVKLPEWVDRSEWFKLSANGRWSAVQAVMLLLGDEGHAGGMAALRGFPADAPAFLLKEAWDRASNSRLADAASLERHASLDVALETQAEQDRARAIMLCTHEWSEHTTHLSKACMKCGHIEDLRVGYA